MFGRGIKPQTLFPHSLADHSPAVAFVFHPFSFWLRPGALRAPRLRELVFWGEAKRHGKAQTIAITGRSYRLKDYAAIAGKEDKNKMAKSKSNEPSTAEPAS